jgi:hypothetical protein
MGPLFTTECEQKKRHISKRGRVKSEKVGDLAGCVSTFRENIVVQIESAKYTLEIQYSTLYINKPIEI